ncbi:MAG TPA: hypothetical protein VH277_16565, partial [Gemmatimonadaceae bacterium]|nr:hypothetical protein [Gemmatimonadaceae bacterium]
MAPLITPDVLSRTTTTTLGTFTLPIPSTNANNYAPYAAQEAAGGQPFTSTGITVPPGACYRVHVDGNVTVSSNTAASDAYPNSNLTFSADGSYGPRGRASSSQLFVELRTRDSLNNVNPLYFDSDTSNASTAKTGITCTGSRSITIDAGRTGIPGSIGGPNGTFPFYLLASGQTVTVDQLTNFIHLSADKAAVHPSEQVTFTTTSDEGDPQVQSWHWQPDAGQPGSAQNPCWNLNPCQFNPQGSGTMTVYTTFGSQQVHVIVYTNFRLDVDQTSVHDGDTVTFTPMYDGVAGPAGRWKWVPDTPAPDSTACPDKTGPCKKSVMQSGTMWAYSTSSAGGSDSKHVAVTIPNLSLYAHFQSGPVGRTVTFTPNWADG